MTSLYCSQGHDNPVDNRFCRLCGELLSPAGLQPAGAIGQLLGLRYKILRELGQGGFGRTYLAEDAHRFNELCVLKEFAPQVQGVSALQKAEELFAREAGVLYKLQHPQIPQFRELLRDEVQGKGRLFLVQDYIQGPTYEELLQSRKIQGSCFTEPEVTQLLLQILPVLTYIHRAGVIHRDISPDNLIHRDRDGLPVLIDFGGVKHIAAVVVHQVNAAIPVNNATRLGKVGYAPDEQMKTGEAYPHSDLYALAVTVLVLLTGKEPQALFDRDRRQWQREVRVGPTLMTVLDGMLDPSAARRYQSAQEVLEVLTGNLAMPDYGLAAAGSAYPGQPDPVQIVPTLAISGASPGSMSSAQNQAPAQTQPAAIASPHKSSGFRPWLLIGLLALGTAGGWWVGYTWLKPLFKSSPPSQGSQPSQSAAPEPSFSKTEQDRKQAISNRRETLKIDNGFLVSLVDDGFYAKHPIGRALSKGPEDEAFRADWDAIANQYLDRLQTLSSSARSRLGSYTTADLDKRRAAANTLNLSSRALNDLTDGQFFHLFPEVPRNQDLLQKPIGQVWQAIAAEQLQDLQSGKALEQIKFSRGAFSQQVNGTLQPGQGKAYLAQLSKDQVIQIKLQAPNKTIRLSIYPPTSKLPALLADSTELQWSGKLEKSGLYEIVVVSTAADATNYQLELAAAENITSPKSTP